MDTLTSMSSFIRYSTTGIYTEDKTVILTTENANTTLLSVKEYHSLKIKLNNIDTGKIEKFIFQTYDNDCLEIMTGQVPAEIILNECMEETSLVPGIYGIEVYTFDDNMYEYFFEVMEQHTEGNALNQLRDTINDYAHGLAINPSMSGQNIISTVDETDHLLELLKKRWDTARGLIEVIKRNPVVTLNKTHELRNELVKIDPYVIRYRDKHIGSHKILQPRTCETYDNTDNYALISALELFMSQIDYMSRIIEEKLERYITESAKLNTEKRQKEMDKFRIDRGNFDVTERLSASNAVNYIKARIRNNTRQLVHVRMQLSNLSKLKNDVIKGKSNIESLFNLKTIGYKRTVPVYSVLYKNCIEILTNALEVEDLVNVAPHKGFNYKRSEVLFEYFGLLKVFQILIDTEYIPGEEFSAVMYDYSIISESRFHFTKENKEIVVIYDTEALSSYPADTYVGLVSENSISRRPDIVIEGFIDGKIAGIIIIEAKYRKVSYLHNNNILDTKGMFHKTEVEKTMSDYMLLKYYIPDEKEKEISSVIVYYPKQKRSVPDNWNRDFGLLKKYGHFVATDISSHIEDKDTFYRLVEKQIADIFEY